MILEDYRTFTTEFLLDLLARKTEKLTQLMADKRLSQEYEDVKWTIIFIQSLIALRQDNSMTA
jgi:hypothetical protein